MTPPEGRPVGGNLQAAQLLRRALRWVAATQIPAGPTGGAVLLFPSSLGRLCPVCPVSSMLLTDIPCSQPASPAAQQP